MHSPVRPAIAVICFLLAISFAISPFFVQDFGGFDPGQFPVPQDNPPVQPAGYAFAIWGPIYIWLVLGTGWGALRALRDGPWHEMRVPLAVSLAIGTFWLPVAVTSVIWSTVMIWIMLVAALIALILAPAQDRLWAALPIGLFAGWLSAASCVSLGLLAAGFGWLDQGTAAMVFIGIAIVLATVVQASIRRAPTYGFGVIWALVAVAVNDWQSAPMVAWLAVAGCVIVGAPTLAAIRRG